MNEKISIIVPVYNAELYVERCLESICNQTYKNIEILVIDDGSTDNSFKICKEFEKKDARVKLIHKDNEGVSRTRNVALEQASGSYIMFVDSDDWIKENMCQLMLNSITDEESDVAICEYIHYIERENKEKKIEINDYGYREFKDIISDDRTKAGGFSWNKMIRKDRINYNFDENIHNFENLLFLLRNSDAIKKFSIVHEALYVYNINENSTIHTSDFSLKKTSTLDGLNEILKYLDCTFSINCYKRNFVENYCRIHFYLKYFKLDTSDVEKYNKDYINYYKDLIKSNCFSIKEKIKLFLRVKLNWLYNLFLYIKAKKNETKLIK